MAAFSWLRWLRSWFRPQVKTYRRSKPRKVLGLEHLETRITPTTYTWKGGAAAGVTAWHLGANWVGNQAPSILPGSVNNLVFSTGAANLTPNDDITGLVVSSITISNVAGYNLTSAPGISITLGSATTGGGTLSLVSANLETIAIPILLGGSTSANQDNFTVGAGSKLTMSGALSGNADLIYTGPGLMVLPNSNSAAMNGPIDIHSGVISIQNGNALGSAVATNTIAVETNATLQVDNSGGSIVTPIKQSLLLNGQGSINQGALYYLNGSLNNNAIWKGNVTLDSNTEIGASTFVGNNALTGAGEGTFTISGVISDNSTGHNLTIGSNTNSGTTTGEIIFSGANTYRGSTTVNDGILDDQNNFGLGHAPIGAAPSNADNLLDTATTVNSTNAATGTLELDGSTSPTGGITVSNQLLILNGPFYYLKDPLIPIPPAPGPNPNNEGPDQSPGIYYTIGFQQSGAPLDVINGNDTWAGEVVLGNNDPIIGVFGQPDVAVTKNPSLTIGGLNGITNLPFGDTTGSITNATVSAVTGELLFSTPTTAALVSGESVFLTGVGGYPQAAGAFEIKVDSSTTFELVNGPLGLAAGAYTGGGTWTLGPLNGPNALNKIGNGSLILTAGNPYVGVTLVETGILEIENPNALGFGASDTTVLNGASLELADDFPLNNNIAPFNMLTMANNLNITGNGYQYDAAGNTVGALYSHDGINSWVGTIELDTFIEDTGGAAIGVDAAQFPTGTPFDYDINSVGTVLDDSLSIPIGGSITGGAPFPGLANSPTYDSLTKVGAGQLILDNANTYLGATNINQGWVTIENPDTLGVDDPTVSANVQPVVTVANGASLQLLPLSATPADEQQVLTLNGVITGGTFTLGNIIQEGITSPITWSANNVTLAANIQAALNTTLADFGAGAVTVTSNIAITGLTSGISGPIVVTTLTTAGLVNGQTVTLAGVLGNVAANGTWTVSNVTATTFQLVGPTNNGTWTVNTGTWSSGVFLISFNAGLVADNYIPTLTTNTTDLTGTSITSSVVPTVGGSAGDMTVPNNLVLAGTGINYVNAATDLPYYPLINQQGALMSLAGSNVITGNITLDDNPAGLVGIGVEQVFSSDPNSVNYSAANNVASQLALLGVQSEALPGEGIAKLGSQRLIIVGPGTFTGSVDIIQGVLLLQNSTGLGDGLGSTTTVEAGTALELANGIAPDNGGILGGIGVEGENLVLNGAGDPLLNDPAPLDVLAPSDNSTYDPALGPMDDPIIATDTLWAGNVTFDTPITVTFQGGALAGAAQPTLTANIAGLIGTVPTVHIVTTITGQVSPITNAPQNAVQAISFGGSITGGTFTLKYAALQTAAINWSSNPTILAQNIQAALIAPTVLNTAAANLGVAPDSSGNVYVPNNASGTDRLTFSGVVDDTSPDEYAGGVDLLPIGGGELDLTANDTYLGTTIVSTGVLNIQGSNALGSAGNAGEQTLVLFNPVSAVGATQTQFTLTYSGSAQTTTIAYTGTAADATAIQNCAEQPGRVQRWFLHRDAERSRRVRHHQQRRRHSGDDLAGRHHDRHAHPCEFHGRHDRHRGNGRRHDRGQQCLAGIAGRRHHRRRTARRPGFGRSLDSQCSAAVVPGRASADRRWSGAWHRCGHRPHQRHLGRSDRSEYDLHRHGGRRRLENDRRRSDVVSHLRRHSGHPGDYRHRGRRDVHANLQRRHDRKLAVQRHRRPGGDGAGRPLDRQRRGRPGDRDRIRQRLHGHVWGHALRPGRSADHDERGHRRRDHHGTGSRSSVCHVRRRDRSGPEQSADHLPRHRRYQ